MLRVEEELLSDLMENKIVLILVLVDVTRWESEAWWTGCEIISLNPCFSGCYALRDKVDVVRAGISGLNPCFSGCYALSDECYTTMIEEEES